MKIVDFLIYSIKLGYRPLSDYSKKNHLGIRLMNFMVNIWDAGDKIIKMGGFLKSEWQKGCLRSVMTPPDSNLSTLWI